jgi:hypothetical protein
VRPSYLPSLPKERGARVGVRVRVDSSNPPDAGMITKKPLPCKGSTGILFARVRGGSAVTSRSLESDCKTFLACPLRTAASSYCARRVRYVSQISLSLLGRCWMLGNVSQVGLTCQLNTCCQSLDLVKVNPSVKTGPWYSSLLLSLNIFWRVEKYGLKNLVHRN